MSTIAVWFLIEAITWPGEPVHTSRLGVFMSEAECVEKSQHTRLISGGPDKFAGAIFCQRAEASAADPDDMLAPIGKFRTEPIPVPDFRREVDAGLGLDRADTPILVVNPGTTWHDIEERRKVRK